MPEPGDLRQHRRHAGDRPAPGNSTSNCAHDNIALLDLAVSRLPGSFRHNVLVRLDGAGFPHELLEHIAAGGGKRGRHWEFSVGWACTDVEDVEMDAIARLPETGLDPGTDQNGDVLDDTFAADLTSLPGLDTWTVKIPGLRILVREEPLNPGRSVEPGATVGPQPCPQNGNPDQKAQLVIKGTTPSPQ